MVNSADGLGKRSRCPFSSSVPKMNHIRSQDLKKPNIVGAQQIPLWVRTGSAKVSELWWPSIYQDTMAIRSDVVLTSQVVKITISLKNQSDVVHLMPSYVFRLEKAIIWAQRPRVKPKFRHAFKSEWDHVWIQNRIFLTWDMSWFESFPDFKPFEPWVELIQTLRKPLASWGESMQDFGIVSWFDQNEFHLCPTPVSPRAGEG